MLWLPVLLAFVAAAYGVWRRASWTLPVLGVTATTSLVLCVLALPAAIIGVAIDAIILAVVAGLVLRPRSTPGWSR